MQKSIEVKEKLISATMELLEASSGHPDAVTTRAIAEKAGVGVGLINYHFRSKELLIQECVQRVIEQVVSRFKPKQTQYESDQERLTDWAAQVFDFLTENRAISRISILGDMQEYSIQSNSVKTQQGLSYAIRETLPDSEKQWLSFLLVSVMQVAFLGSDACRERLGYDFTKPEDRRAFLSRLVSTLIPSNP
ncbi:TetR/AcrR family transcriptional regulator [Gorillibacterium sp. CAU 1737]|uniref:TetR/AcrR family transcriptional regulator n=1 Tax=Gorillibacterium sp. CAU 1737 TaxID=3140362 RepID=UPI0032600F24